MAATRLNDADDLNIDQIGPLIPPQILMEDIPLSEKSSIVVRDTRNEIQKIYNRDDDRLVVVVGPCSVHDVKAAKEYCDLLKNAKEEFKEDLLIVMRVYFEKPRTTVGWKGLINDPFLDNTFQINKGLRVGRQLLLDLNDAGMPAAVEFLDTITPQFLGDLVSWGAIGARTTESQVHRELASGLSCPVGFKNGTSGNIEVAVQAISSSANPHRFLSVTKHGIAAIVTTKGNKHCHVILRGGFEGPNYESEYVKKTTELMEKNGVKPNIMIDCSHGNSKKIHSNQPVVAKDIGDQIRQGERNVFGVMIESNLKEGNQKLSSQLEYGVSITDACISFEQTLPVLEELASAVRARRAL